jgi:hypothetical protein
MAVTESSQLSRVVVKKKKPEKSEREARELRGKAVTESSQLSGVVVKKKNLKSQREKQESCLARRSERLVLPLALTFQVFFFLIFLIF